MTAGGPQVRADGVGELPPRLRPLTATASCLLALVLLAAATRASEDVRESGVGVAGWIRELVLPGTELRPADRDAATPVVVRVASVSPHGSDLRYDVEWYGLEPGTYDLTDYLARVDGSSTDDLPDLTVTVTSRLPPGQVEPTPLLPGPAEAGGGYRRLLWIAGVAWVVGLAWLLRAGRRGAKDEASLATRPQTLAERLRPLVEQARAGTLSADRLAELERALIAFWRRRLGLESADAGTALATLRSHAEAGPLVVALETWLHSPGSAADVDLDGLLKPYEQVSVDPSEPA